MRVALLILLVSVSCGCPVHRSPVQIEKQGSQVIGPRPEARARVHLEGGRTGINPANPRSDLELFLAGAMGQGLAGRESVEGFRPAVAEAWKKDPTIGWGSSWTFYLSSEARFPNGTLVRPEDVIASWESAIGTEGSPARWLLEPVAGSRAFGEGGATRIEGLEAHGNDLLVRLTRPVPDFLERLAHPTLAIWRIRPEGTLEGPGAFTLVPGEAKAVANLQCMYGRPILDRIELVEAGSADPSLLLRLGEVDLAVVYGRAVSRLLQEGLEGYTIRRLPSWDRVYALWLSPGPLNRWTRDPSFRRWLSERIDRAAMVNYLFAGQGEPARGLIAGGELSEAENVPNWKVPPVTRPRLTLTFDGGDAHAASLAARVKADLDHAGLNIGLDGADTEQLHRRLSREQIHVALLLHRPATSDPVLALAETLGGVGGTADTVRSLEAGSLEAAGTPARKEAALRAERRLLENHRLVPLVRLHAWLVMDQDLVDVEAGPSGVLGMERAGWRP